MSPHASLSHVQVGRHPPLFICVLRKVVALARTRVFRVVLSAQTKADIGARGEEFVEVVPGREEGRGGALVARVAKADAERKLSVPLDICARHACVRVVLRLVVLDQDLRDPPDGVACWRARRVLEERGKERATLQFTSNIPVLADLAPSSSR